MSSSSLHATKECSCSSYARLDFGLLYKVNSNIRNHFLINHNHIIYLWILVSVESSLNCLYSILHKRDFMVGSVVETMMVHTKNTKLCCPALSHYQQTCKEGCNYGGKHNISFVRCC